MRLISRLLTLVKAMARQRSSQVLLRPAVVIALIAAIAMVDRGRAGNYSEFVKTSGVQFTLHNAPFYITGVNNHYLTYGSQTEVDRVLNDAVALHANVIRIFLQPVIGSPDDWIFPWSVWNWRKTGKTSDLVVNGNYLLYWDKKTHAMGINDGPNGMQKVDYLIAAAKKRNLRLIICFLDFWSYTGGMQQMRAWYGSWDEDHFFFADPRTTHDYKVWVKHVIERKNPQTGLRYRDDPSIMAWELANEANAKPESLRFQWTADMSKYVKSLDHNHLVASGNANPDPENFDISIPSIDFGTWHGYPLYLKIGVDDFDKLIRRYCDTAPVYGKPVLLEEFGYARSNPDQAEAYAKWLKTIAADPNCSGWLLWRLVSLQDDGEYPADDHPVAQFDLHNDGGPLWQVVKAAIARGRDIKAAIARGQE